MDCADAENVRRENESLRGGIEFRAVGRYAAFNLAAEYPCQRARRRFRVGAAIHLIAFTHALH